MRVKSAPVWNYLFPDSPFFCDLKKWLTNTKKIAAKPLFIGGDVVNTHANELKNCLLKIIDEMALSSDIFNLSGKPAFCRKSKFNFSTLIQFILSFGSNSLGHEIGEFFEYRKGFPTVSAFVQQRKKLSYTALEHLFYRFNECTFKKPVLYKNYRLLAIDGSDFSLPYNSQEDNVMGDNHFSTLHLNALFDVCSKSFLDVIVQKGLHENETGAACELVDRISEKHPVIIMADRGYENYNLFAHIEERLFDYVVRVRDSDNSCMVSGLNLPKTEEYDITKRVVLTRHFSGPAAINTEKYKYLSKKSRFDYIENSKSPDYEITIRFVRFLLDDNTYEVIATSLPEEIFSMEDLKEIYHQRWGIETGFRELKYVLGLSAFHSKQENSILQEIYARLVMYNFSMLIAQHVKPKEKDLKYKLQINFTQATKICLNFFRYKGKEPPYDIEATIQRFLLPIRPNRKRQRVSVSTCVVSFNYRLA